MCYISVHAWGWDSAGKQQCPFYVRSFLSAYERGQFGVITIWVLRAEGMMTLLRRPAGLN